MTQPPAFNRKNYPDVFKDKAAERDSTERAVPGPTRTKAIDRARETGDRERDKQVTTSYKMQQRANAVRDSVIRNDKDYKKNEASYARSDSIAEEQNKRIKENMKGRKP